MHNRNDQEALLSELEEASGDYQEARKIFAEARKKLTDAETLVINSKLRVERITEALRMLKAQEVVKGEDYALFDDEDSSR